MNRMIKLFQQKADNKLREYELAKGKTTFGPKDYPGVDDLVVSVLKAEALTWQKAADLLRKEELNK